MRLLQFGVFQLTNHSRRCARHQGSRRHVLGDHRAGSDECFFADGHALANKAVALDLAAPAYDGVLLNLDKRPDQRIIADPAAVKDWQNPVA